MSRARAALLALALTGCKRGCAGDAPPAEPAAHHEAPQPPPPPLTLSPRCVREIVRAPVVTAPGTGAIDTIAPTCSGGTLALFVVRGHTLSRLTRSTAAASGFDAPETWSTGVDRLGPVAPDAVRGPVTWRSPLAGIDPDERDDLWAAALGEGDAGVVVTRGDALLPAGIAGIGAPVVQERSAAGVTLLATVARPQEGPFTARVRVTLGRDEPAQPTELPTWAEGELKAWEPSRGVGLARVETPGGAWLEATWAAGGARVRHQLGGRHALVAPRGVAVGGRSVFGVGEFERGAGDAGACLVMGEGMCVRPTGMYALVAGAPGAALERVELAEAGLPDAIAARGDALWVLYLAPEDDGNGAQTPSQRAARVDLAHREVTPLVLSPPRGFGAIDGPTLVACDDGVWMAAELVTDEDAGARGSVTALPLECFAR